MLSDQNIVITGATSGIGRELVNQLAANNQLWVLARDANKLQQLAQQYPNVHPLVVDLACADALNQVIQQLQQQLPCVDLLINNAAVQHTACLTDEDFNRSTIAREMAVNFNAAAQLCHGLLPLLRQSTNGRILNINSALALVPKRQSAIYNASKAALHIFSLSLSYQLKPLGIRVQQAYLPLVDTQMTLGRGRNKISASSAAQQILLGLQRGKQRHYIGKVKLLMVINYLFPALARRIMQYQ